MDIIESIINTACEVWRVSRADIFGNCRKQPLPLVRINIAALISEKTSLPPQEIGEILGKNRTTILYYLRQYGKEYKYNSSFHRKAESILEKLSRKSVKKNILQMVNEMLFGKCSK